MEKKKLDRLDYIKINNIKIQQKEHEALSHRLEEDTHNAYIQQKTHQNI